jgi:Ca2+-transporting ATPase
MESVQVKWHARSAEQVAEDLQTDVQQGLSNIEVNERLQRYGENRISTKKQQSGLVRFLLQFHQPLVYILLGATLVTIVLGEYADAVVIFVV